MRSLGFSPFQKNNGARGFSLIEVLIALSIMAGSLIVVSMAWSTSNMRLKKMKLNHQVAYLLDFKVAELERKYKNEITLLPEEASGTFEDLSPEYKSFTWKMKSKKFELPDLTPLLAQQSGGANPMITMVLDQMSDYFNQSVKELTVTVVYTVKKTNVEYSASTFLIDYNQVLPLPNLGGAGGGNGP